MPAMSDSTRSALLAELLPMAPTIATEIMPELTQRLASRVAARFVREVYL